ncbi:hypothetical protein EGW08_011961 [Elysia chlorotica]|uniref:Uncharacterized protein n=1 Tax=Elysia chlorotica TaxID=188477 RepID=A0A3S1B5D2_ELYCH|nr:hypothetical protein EGW08_011961 [Elysia chlorotica]
MAKDRLNKPPEFYKYYDIATKATYRENTLDGAKRAAGVGKSSVSTKRKMDGMTPRFSPPPSVSGKERAHRDKAAVCEESRSSAHTASSKSSSSSHRYVAPLTSLTHSHFPRKTKTKSTLTPSSSVSQAKLPPKHTHSKTSSHEPKSILKNSPRRRLSTTSDDDVLFRASKQTQTTMQYPPSCPLRLSPTSSSALTWPAEIAGAAPTNSTQPSESDLSDVMPCLRGEDISHDLYSRLRICYARSISERPVKPADPHTAAAASQCQDKSRQDTDKDILSRCSYRLAARPRRASEPSVSKRVTFHDQAPRLEAGVPPPKL